MSGQVHFTVSNGIGAIVFDRPEARNAMTFAMYDALASICDQIAADRSLRVVTLRGAGGAAFVAGTDIEQFRAFSSPEDGVAYEAKIDARIGQLERLRLPTIAIVDGWAVGGGLLIAAACDLRIAAPAARNSACRSPAPSAIASRPPIWRASSPASASPAPSAC